MRTTAKIIRYVLHDLARSRWLLAYALLFLVSTDLLFRFGGGDARAVISLMNIVLLFIPLVALVFGLIYIYNAREFIELLLTQPVNRSHLFFGMFGGLALPLTGAFLLGAGLPAIYLGTLDQAGLRALASLLITGVALTLIFAALAFWLATRFEDRIRGLGVAVAVWLFSVLLYDGLIMLVVFSFADYPLDKTVLALSILNPVDMGRILLLLQLDIAALMGYTGAVFSRFFGSTLGLSVALTSLLLWVALPLLAGARQFRVKDF